MSQTTTGVPTKITGNTYTAAEFNSVNDAVNANAADAISSGDTSDQTIASNLDFATGKGVSFDGGDVLSDYEEGTFTVTVTPETSGTITISSNNVLSYTRVGRLVTVTGQINIGSVSSPVGSSATLSSLPFSSADLSQFSGRSSFTVTNNAGALGTYTQVPCTIVESSTDFVFRMDASTFAASDQYWFSFSYVTGA